MNKNKKFTLFLISYCMSEALMVIATFLYLLLIILVENVIFQKHGLYRYVFLVIILWGVFAIYFRFIINRSYILKSLKTEVQKKQHYFFTKDNFWPFIINFAISCVFYFVVLLLFRQMMFYTLGTSLVLDRDASLLYAINIFLGSYGARKVIYCASQN